MNGLLRRILRALLGAPPQPVERERPPAERLDAAQQKLKQTIPPPED